MIQIKNLSFYYTFEEYVLKNINLQIDKGESVAIVGENGSGKTTLVKHLNGLLKPSKGDVIIDKLNTKNCKMKDLIKYVGYLFQNPDDQIFEKTVWKEVAYGPTMLGYTDDKVSSLVKEALKLTGLIEYEFSHPFDLTFSQRRLLSLASVLAMDTPIVVLDEPTLALDRKDTLKLSKLIKSLKKKKKTVIIISHDMDFCAENAERFIVLSKGEVRYDGPKEQLLARKHILQSSNLSLPRITELAKDLKMNGLPYDVSSFLSCLKITDL